MHLFPVRLFRIIPILRIGCMQAGRTWKPAPTMLVTKDFRLASLLVFFYVYAWVWGSMTVVNDR
jgi:hypothetical protein